MNFTGGDFGGFEVIQKHLLYRVNLATMVFDVPSPTHGFFRVVLAFWAYLGVVFGITTLFRQLLPDALGGDT